MVKSAVGNWLDKKFVEWQAKEGGRRTVADFVNYLGISRPTFDRWNSGKRIPDERYAELLADKLGDDSIYDAVGLPKPDGSIRVLKKLLPNLTDDEKRKMIADLEKKAKKRNARKR